MFPQRSTAPSDSVFKLARVLRLVALGVVLLAAGHAARAAGTLIPAPSRVDMVYDSARDTIYITSAGSVLRYQIGTNSFQSPFELGGSLSGIDLSPDGNTLAVADKTRSATEVWIHLVDLTTGVSRKVTFPRAFGEGGTFTVAFAGDGAVLTTSIYEGSGWVPMRRYDPATGASSVVAPSASQDGMLTASADGSVIGFTEGNISDGRFGRYRVADGDLLRKSYSDAPGWFVYEMGVNRDGTQYAIPTYGGTYVYDADLRRITILGQYAGPQPVGVVYHPAENIVYFAWATTTQVRAFDTNTFAQAAAYDFEHGFTTTGNRAFTQGRLKISRDGSLLFATVNGGVRYQRLYAPLAADNQEVNTYEDSTTIVNLTGSVGNGREISYSVASNPAHGTLGGVAPYLTYRPDPDYNGTDSFTFKTTYGAASVEATVSITVNPVNDAPVADGQSLTTTEDFGPTFVMSGSDVEGDPLTYSIVSPPSHGQIVAVSFYGPVYMPDPDFHGEDSFTFKANDGALDSYPATISVTVTPVNDAPTAHNQIVATGEDTARAITLAGSDVDGDGLNSVIVSGPSHGTLSGSGLNLVYTPAANYSGDDSFSFKVNDGSADSNVATVRIQVSPVNDAPVANGQAVTTTEDSFKAITLSGSDVDGGGLSYVVVSGPAHGTVSMGSGGNVTYRPAANYNGADSFTFKVNDGAADSNNVATVAIQVTPVNDAPVAAGDAATTTRGVPVSIPVRANDTDVDGDVLTVVSVSQGSGGGTVTISGGGTGVTLSPRTNFVGQETFTYTVSDGKGGTSAALVTVNVLKK
ncbi:MAG TPA: Ig-like domain-containing protein [Pyrinomonadaceae bacterium]|nr:Ig-like domain-containing protein [Pyrinomonadaceae bacterium]